MRTTLTLEEDVAKKLMERTRVTRKSFKAIVNETLRLGLNAKRVSRPMDRFVAKPRALGLRSGISYDNVGELLDALDK